MAQPYSTLLQDVKRASNEVREMLLLDAYCLFSPLTSAAYGQEIGISLTLVGERVRLGSINSLVEGRERCKALPPLAFLEVTTMAHKKSFPNSSPIADTMGAEFGAFELGRLLATPSALEALLRYGLHPLALIALHAQKLWGVIDDEDGRSNEKAIMNGGRILSAYDADGKKLYVITEAVGADGHRACTTVLLAREY
jgi:hypothetical protein